MLEIYFDDEIVDTDKDKLILDVEEAFDRTQLKLTDVEKAVVKLIDQGELLDGISFIDRFGYKLYTSELSTGCKAALVVINNTDKIVSLAECGFNARDIIINLCKDGKVMIRYSTITINEYSKDINIKLDKYKFTSVNRLNYYIQDERPYEPDMSYGGIEYV